MKTAVTIAGSDCSGGAGIQADIKTMSALGVYSSSVIVSVVAENTSRVIAYENVSPKMIKSQIDAIFEDMEIDAVKVGMLNDIACMETVAERLAFYNPANVVIDPVMYAKDGTPLMKEDCCDAYIKKVIPVATLLTPNIPEAERITGLKISDEEDMKRAAKAITKFGTSAALIKGGHSEGDPCDILYDGKEIYCFRGARIQTKNTHGTGCTLSSAITSYLALGETLPEAVKKAKEYISTAITHSLDIGRGAGPLNHFYSLYNEKREKQR